MKTGQQLARDLEQADEAVTEAKQQATEIFTDLLVDEEGRYLLLQALVHSASSDILELHSAIRVIGSLEKRHKAATEAFLAHVSANAGEL